MTGDVNINSLKWMKDDLLSTDSTYKLKVLTELLFEKINCLGVSQQVSVATNSLMVMPKGVMPIIGFWSKEQQSPLHV